MPSLPSRDACEMRDPFPSSFDLIMSSTTATARSLAPSSPPKKCYRGNHTNGVSSPTWRCGPTKQQMNKRVSKAPKKSGKPRQPYRKRRNTDSDHPKHNVLLHRLSLPCSPPSGTLLERMGGTVEDEAASIVTDSDRTDVPDGVDIYTGLPFSATTHFYTPEPGEVERFLESVIGAPPPPSPPTDAVHTCLGNKPTLALETHNLPVDHVFKVEDPPDSVLYSPTQTAVNSIPSTNLTLDQSPLLGDTMPPPSASTLEECRKHLVAILLSSARARNPGKRLDSEQCHRLLSDDHCKDFFRQAKEMRHQLSSLVSQKTLVMNQGSKSGSLKRDRGDDVGAWIRSTRSRFDSVNTVASEVSSRRDSDITLVDFPGGRLPPRAPRAMLQASPATWNRSLDSARGEAPCEPLVSSPTTEDRPAGAPSLVDLVHQAIKLFPMLAVTSEIDTSNVPVGTPAREQSGHPSQVVPLAQPLSSSSSDFVSHLPTQPGIWFRQQGRHYAEIVDVDIDVSDDMFYLSKEHRPFRLRMGLRLCSVPVSATSEDKNGDTPGSKQDVDGVIERHALHWPTKGKLVVQVNPESERSKTWLPYTLASDPLDVTSCMRPGKNTFRFIQLSDLSEFTFILTASPPPPSEEWRSWDWASLMERSRSRADKDTGSPSSPSLTNDSVDDLSEFAHIPVTVRS